MASARIGAETAKIEHRGILACKRQLLSGESGRHRQAPPRTCVGGRKMGQLPWSSAEAATRVLTLPQEAHYVASGDLRRGLSTEPGTSRIAGNPGQYPRLMSAPISGFFAAGRLSGGAATSGRNPCCSAQHYVGVHRDDIISSNQRTLGAAQPFRQGPEGTGRGAPPEGAKAPAAEPGSARSRTAATPGWRPARCSPPAARPGRPSHRRRAPHAAGKQWRVKKREKTLAPDCRHSSMTLEGW